MVVRLFLYGMIMLSSCLSHAENTIDKDTNVFFYQSGAEVSQVEIDLWQRELLSIKIDILSTEEFSYIKTERFENNEVLIESRILTSTANNKKGQFTKSIIFHIWPLEQGQQQLIVAPVYLMLSGRVIREVNIAPIEVNVKALPDYLPPGFPVGLISVNSHYKTETLLPAVTTPGHLSTYSLEVNSKGLHSSLMPDYINYLSATDITRLAVSETTQSKTDDIDYSFVTTHKLPIVVSSSGIKSFDQFKILSFDPQSGKVISHYFDSVSVISLNNIIQLLLLLCLLSALYYLVRLLKILYSNISYRRELWKQIYSSQNAAALSLALRNLSHDYPLFKQTSLTNACNFSLSQWAADWNSQTLQSSIMQLNKLQFSPSSAVTFAEVKSTIVELIKTQDKLLHCFIRTAKTGI